MITQSPDTHPDAEKVLISLLRNLSVAQRISRVRSLSERTVLLSRRAISRANPDLNEREQIVKIIAYHYGEKLADRLAAYIRNRPL